MERCNKIYNHLIYKEKTANINRKEKDRIFCKHNLEHALDVARIGYIYILENHIDIDKELFYTAALLHDAGRYSNAAHNVSGAALAREIMPQCDFTETETEMIANAIEGHRSDNNADVFSKILYEADKKSRICFICEAQDECYWEQEKRNLKIEI